MQPEYRIDCSGLPGRTTLRHHELTESLGGSLILFRSSRPDYIETILTPLLLLHMFFIVPVFQAGLH